MMVYSCIKYYLIVQGVYAKCNGATKNCIVPSLADAEPSDLSLVQIRALEVPVPRSFRDFAASALNDTFELGCDVPQIEGLRENLYWMHIPKTGTSFKFTIQNVNSDFKRGKFHEPLPSDASDSLISDFTTMLREPAQRLASAFAYIKECPRPQGGWMWTEHHGCGAGDVSEKVKKGKTPANDECLASLIGCQTNMLLGSGCMTGKKHSESDIEIAKSRLDKLFFVGLVEEWELSMCLFNYKLTGKRFVVPCQNMDSRPTDTSVPRTEVKQAHVYDVTGYPEDKADEEIYRHGKERFLREIAQYGISKDSCTPELGE